MSRAAPLVDVDAVPDEAFAIAEDLDPFTSEEHQHDKHQLLYAASGSMTLSTKGERWLLPPQRAAWISAGTSHVVASTTTTVTTSALDAQLSGMMGDAPFCDVCGHITVRNGACYKCLNCGNSLGCS